MLTSITLQSSYRRSCTEVILAPIFLKTASKIQNSNLIGWVNVISAARAIALASIMMSLANVFGLGYGVHYLGIHFNDARAHYVARGQELAERRLARQTVSSRILPVIQNI